MPVPPPALGVLDPEAPSPFGRGSVVRTVVANPVTALLVQRALVMDVAHPAVAAGVEHHSRFRAQPLLRAWVTADVALRLTFGDDALARQAVRQIYGVHDRITGEIAGRDGPVRYTAHDAALLRWVWATLVDTAETAFTRWVRPFRPGEADAFYAEMHSFGRFLGIPAGLLPEGRDDFAAYLDGMLDDGALGTDPTSRAVARQVLWFRHWSVLPPVVRLERALALATLDPRLVERLDLPTAGPDVELGRRIDARLATTYRRLPHLPPTTPGLYVRLRRPSIGLARRARGVVAEWWPSGRADRGSRPPHPAGGERPRREGGLDEG